MTLLSAVPSAFETLGHSLREDVELGHASGEALSPLGPVAP